RRAVPRASHERRGRRRRLRERRPEIAVVLIAVVGGALAALAPWWAVVGVVFGLAAVTLIVRDPLFGLLLTLALAAQAIPGAHVPNIPFGGAEIQPAEITVLLTIASTLFNGLIGRRPLSPPSIGFVAIPVLTFAALFVAFAIDSYYLGQRNFALPILRNFLPLALLPLLPTILCNRERIVVVERCLIAFGVLLALFIAVQAFTGTALLAGRIEDLGLNRTTGITRTVLWGPELLIILAIFLIGRDGVRANLVRVWPLAALLILLLGLLGTYTRSFWVATAVAALLLVIFAQGLKGALRLAAVVVPLIAVLAAAVYVANPRIGDAAFARVFGITQEIESGDSFGWRGKENAMAIEAIKKSPWIGIGFDGAYKKSISTQGHFAGEETYIHNAYLYFQLKMGVFGSLILLAFLALYLRLAGKSFAIPDARDRANALIYVVLGVVVLLVGDSGQTLSRFVTLLIVCLMFALMRAYAERH
ncbi:MAG: O-antigen ligase family protein, partial [Propionivibrio sp.]